MNELIIAHSADFVCIFSIFASREFQQEGGRRKGARFLPKAKCFLMYFSEVDFGVVVASLEQLLHLFLRRNTRVGAGACICDGVLGNFRKSFSEYLLRYEALLSRIAVCAIVLDAVRNL